MEDSTITNPGFPNESHPQLTPVSVQYLLTAAKWGKFLAILGFITIIFLILAGLLMGVAFNLMGDKLSGMGGIPSVFSYSWISAIYVVLGLISAIPVYLLNSFSNNVSRAVRNNNTATMSTAFRRLKSLFVFIGVYTIVILALYIILIIVAASAALFAL